MLYTLWGPRNRLKRAQQQMFVLKKRNITPLHLQSLNYGYCGSLKNKRRLFICLAHYY